MLEENLSKLGFSPSEIKVYLHLIQGGCSYPNKISAETNLNRTNVYEALTRLVQKGVASFITKNNIKWYEVKSPKSLFSLIEKKEEEIKETKKSLIKDISSITQNQNNSLEANIYVGKKGLRILFEDMLDAKKPIYLLGAMYQFSSFFGSYFDLWHKKRAAKNIIQKAIFPNKLKNVIIPKPLLKTKFIDNSYLSPTGTWIYGNSVLLIQWSKEPLAIKIEKNDIANSHLNYFNILWNN